MPGFPNRISRASLGPSLVDTWPVTDETKAIPSKSFNLAWWQLAGSGLTAARGLLQVVMNGTQPETVFQALAWDPDGTLPNLLWVRDSAGVYSYSFPQTDYPDESGSPVTLALLGAHPVTQNLIAADPDTRASHDKTGPRAGTIRTMASGVVTEYPDASEFTVFLL